MYQAGVQQDEVRSREQLRRPHAPRSRWAPVAAGALIVTFLAITGPTVTAPYTEPAAAGRSSVNATIARNFFENGFRLFHPQLDYGPPPGFVGQEFSLVPFQVAIVYLVTGVQDWPGRVVALAYGAGTILLVYLLARLLFASPAAAVAAAGLVVLSPLFTYFSRTFQSDSAMIFFVTLGAYGLARWRSTGREAAFAVGCAAAVVGMLLKPSSLCLVPALCAIAVTGPKGSWRRAATLLLTIGSAVVLYYWHAAQINAYTGTIGLDAVARRASLDHILNLAFYRQIVRDVVQAATPLGILAMPFALAAGLRDRALVFLPLWAGGVVALNVVFNEALAHHEYYQMLWVPLAACSAGLVVDRMSGSAARAGRVGRLAAAVIVLLLGTASLVVYARFMTLRLQFPEGAARRVQAGRLAAQFTPPGAFVAAEDIDILYYAHRRGWIYFTDPGENAQVSRETLEARQADGAQYLVTSNGLEIFEPDAVRFLEAQGGLVAAAGLVQLWSLTQK